MRRDSHRYIHLRRRRLRLSSRVRVGACPGGVQDDVGGGAHRLGRLAPITVFGRLVRGGWVSVRRGPGEEHQTELAHLNLVAVG